MNKPSIVILANDYQDQNPTGHWMSEKLDGVRAFWNGKQLLSRYGNPFKAPSWFISQLPKDVTLDGELWEGRGQFQTTVGRVRANNGDWSNIKFMVFDTVNEKTFEERMADLSQMVLPFFCQIVKQTLCTGPRHLEQFEQNLLNEQAEGVMIRAAHSPYTIGRTDHLLKLKRFYSDEARVIGYKKGTGRNANTVGSLVCSWRGKKFSVSSGLTDELRANPPKIGSKITFKYFEKTTDGNPRHPVFLAVRDYEGPTRIKANFLAAEIDLADTLNGQHFPLMTEAEHHEKYDVTLMADAMNDEQFRDFIETPIGDPWIDAADIFCIPDIILKEQRQHDFGTFLPRDAYRSKIWALYVAYMLDVEPDTAEHTQLLAKHPNEWQRQTLGL